MKSGLLKNALLIFAIVTGTLLRIYPVWQAGFVIHDGGLFYEMAKDIQTNGYMLPVYTSYNQAQIPFVYPPLMLLILAILNGELHISLLVLLRWLPAMISTLTIPIFYLLARSLLVSGEQAALATVFFALTPSSLGAQIMGGGLTRAAGALFALLFLYFLYNVFMRGGLRLLIFAALSGALLVLSHPEWSLHALLAAVVFWGYFGVKHNGNLKALSIVGLIILFTSPWWGTVISRHGLAPFWAVSHAAQSFHLSQIFNVGIWTGEIIPLVLILAIIGWVAALFSPFSFLSLWLLLDFLVEPRGALRTASLEMALLAAYSVSWCLSHLRTWKPLTLHGSVTRRLSTAFIILLLVITLFNSLVTGVRLSKYHVLTAADLQAFGWIKSHTPPSSHFLIFAPQDIFMSPALEWFPALTDRVSINTIQGTEWLTDPARTFTARYEQYLALEPCQNEQPDCLASWAESYNLSFDYVYFSMAFSEPDQLVGEMSRSPEYILVYDTPLIKIFARIHG